MKGTTISDRMVDYTGKGIFYGSARWQDKRARIGLGKEDMATKILAIIK